MEKWMPYEELECDESGWRCTKCGYEVNDDEDRTPYCPWCGARMGEEE